MAIWQKQVTLAELNNFYAKYMVTHLGIEVTALTDTTLSGRMPVDERTKQPFGILHGGASCVLAESLASIAGNLCVADEDYFAVGLSLNAHHLQSVSTGYVYGHARPIRLGRTIQVWEVDIVDENGEMCCKAQLSMMVRHKVVK